MSGAQVQVSIGTTHATIRRGAHSIVAAAILGRTVEEGHERVYLDRLVHAPEECELGTYRVEGAVSTILLVPCAGEEADEKR